MQKTQWFLQYEKLYVKYQKINKNDRQSVDKLYGRWYYKIYFYAKREKSKKITALCNHSN